MSLYNFFHLNVFHLHWHLAGCLQEQCIKNINQVCALFGLDSTAGRIVALKTSGQIMWKYFSVLCGSNDHVTSNWVFAVIPR